MLFGERKTEDAFDEEGSSKENIKAVFVHNIEDAEAAVRRRIKRALEDGQNELKEQEHFSSGRNGRVKTNRVENLRSKLEFFLMEHC